jgi:hypothetical protein
MKFRHAAALAGWVSRILAVVVLAIPWAWLATQANEAKLIQFESDPQGIFASEYFNPYRYSLTLQLISWSIIGSVYVSAVECLSWGFRKLSHFIFKFRHSRPN